MKRIFGIGLLTVAFLVTLCACGKSTQNGTQSASTPASTSAAEPEHTATLYVMTGGKERGQYDLGYSGELKADQLLQGLSDLTGYYFDAEKVETTDNKITVYWADTATFQPNGTQANVNKDLALSFYDFDSEFQFMLDSTYTTLTKNLGVKNVYFVSASGDTLDFTIQSNWKLPSDHPYNGTFRDYYLNENTTSNDSDSSAASEENADTTESEKDYLFLDRRSSPSDPGDNITPETAAKAVYSHLVKNYQGNTDSASDWYIILDEVKTVNGSEGYSFSVGQGSEENLTTHFHAVVTYDGNIYLLKNGNSNYTLYGAISNS